MVQSKWGTPFGIVCDRFRLGELADCDSGIPLEPRVSRWSEASADIRSLRKFIKDGPLSIEAGSALLLAASIQVSQVKSDDQGNTRLTKSKNNTARDDVAAALVLAAGACDRYNHFERVEEQEEIEVLSF